MRRAIPLIAGALLGLGLGIIVYFGFLKPEKPFGLSGLNLGSESLSSPEIGIPAPNFELAYLSGEQIQLEDYRGQAVLLNFWATWCAPCRLEMPAFQSRTEQFAGELAVVAVNNAEDSDLVQDFVDDFDLSFDVLLDPEAEVQRLYQVRGYPTTYLIDAEGLIRVQHIGLLTEQQLDNYLKELGISK